MMATYTILSSSLYFLSFPIGELFNKVPVLMAFILLRLLVAFFLVFSYHLYYGIEIELEQMESSGGGHERTEFRAARIVCTLALIIWVLFMTFALLNLCYLSGIDGSRVYRPRAFKKFRKISFGNLIF